MIQREQSNEVFSICFSYIDCFLWLYPKRSGRSAILDGNGKAIKAPKNAAATIMHEIAHPLYEGKDQSDVLKFENSIREIINIEVV